LEKLQKRRCRTARTESKSARLQNVRGALIKYAITAPWKAAALNLSLETAQLAPALADYYGKKKVLIADWQSLCGAEEEEEEK